MNDNLSVQARALLDRRLAERQADPATMRLPVLRPDQPNRYAPFPLNDMQQAYWIGRQGDDQSGMHYYMERRTTDFDFPRFCLAWQHMVARHDMLRVVITADGQQRILEHAPGTGLPERHDLGHLSPARQEETLSAMRDALAHYKADLTRWPHHQLHWCDLGSAKGCLLMSLDIWCIDGHSVQTLVNELACTYTDPGCALPAIAMTFRDYVLASQAFEQGPVYAQALAYWRERLANLPAAPSLPLANASEISSPPTFSRCDMILTALQTQAIRALVADQGLTLAMLLAACYAEVLARWSSSRHFVLNMPRFNRKPIHPDIYSVLGEFATFTLLEVRLDTRLSFGERIAAMQEQLWHDMEHDAVSGVRVLRELNQRSGGLNRAPAPIVFTSLPEAVIGSDNVRGEAAALGELTFSLSQTPQVWLDCQYYQDAGRLRLNWDYLAGRFPTGMVEDMFRAFADLVQRLAAPNGGRVLRETRVVVLPAEQLAQRRVANTTGRIWPQVPLAERLTTAAARWPDNLALVAEGQSLSYRQLFERAGALAHLLRDGSGRVAIRLGKSVDQIVATVACLLVGRCYVPLDIEQPEQRQYEIAKQARTELVLTSDRLPAWGGVGRVLAAGQWPDSHAGPFTVDHSWRAEAEIYLLFTSGSTGQPKGVPTSQRGVINLLEHNAKWLALTASDRVFGVSALHHDMSVAELLGSLTQGAALILPGQAERRDPARWLALMQTHGVTYWSSVPALAEMLLDSAGQQRAMLSTLRQVTLGGDWLPVNIGERFRRVAPGAAVHSTGGPTEITVWNITHTLQPADGHRASIPYGKPIANSRYYVVDEDDDDCPVWVCGEMVCAGDGVSPGYLEQDPNRPDAFGPLDGREAHCYRTGDLGRYMPDGSLEFVGRRDSQVKLHGIRIELGEIEGVLQRHPAVNRAVVELRHAPHQRLVAWFDADADEAALRAHASRYLPAAMVPSTWQRCDDWPISANGKVDRRALSSRALQVDSPLAAQDLQGPLEQWLAACWSQLLQREVVSREANFFHLGGDSLLAMRMLGTIEAQSGVRLAAQQIFATPTLHQLTEQIGHRLTAQGQSIDAWSPVATTGFPPRATPAAPLSWSQRGLWLIEQRQPGSAAYTLPLFFALDGPVNVASLCEAVNTVLAGHEILRSRFGFDTTGLRPYLLPDAAPPRLHVIALSPDQDAKTWMEAFTRQGFDLAAGVSARAALVDAGPHGWLLAFQFHHIVFDGWSAGVLMQQVAQAYSAQLNGEAVVPLAYRFGDFAAWQQNQGEDLAARAFWERALVDLPILSLTTDRPRPAQMEWTGSSVSLPVDEKLVLQLEALATRHDATLFMVLLSAYQLLLGRYGQQDDVVVGTYVAGRDHPASLDMLGCFVNNVIMRTPWEPEQSFDSFLRQNRERIIAALSHQHYPFERLVAQAGTPRDDSRHPLYQAGFAMQPRHRWPALAGDLRLRQLPPPLHTAHMDIDLYVVQDAGGLWLELNYLTGLFDAGRMQRFLEHYRCLLEAIVARPQERLVNLRYWPGQWTFPSPAQSSVTIDLPERLLRGLQQGGDRCALHDRGEQTSFAQLLKRSQGLAAGLRARGAGPGVVVGVYLPRSSPQICTMLAILFVGAVYLPLDPDYPPARIEAMLCQAKPAILVSDEAIKQGLPALHARVVIGWRALEAPAPAIPLCCQPLPQAPMYLLFTSGSTGAPKGLFGNWLTAQSRTRWLARTYPLHADDCCAIRTPLHFVDSMWEILDPLLASCACVVAPSDLVIDSRRLLSLMREQSVTRMVVVPSLIRSWLRNAPDVLASWQSLRLLLSSAEAANAQEIEMLYLAMPRLRFVNCYGSSEVADVTAYEWPRPPSRGDELVLGKPISGNQIHLLDKWGQVVPPGNCGHIHIGGDQVFSGYLGQARQQDAASGVAQVGPLFATGDWGHQRADGELVFRGRHDDLAKIRGNRVELAEVNHHLGAAVSGGHAVALAAPDPQGGMQLVAWVEAPMDSRPMLAAEVREILARQLPDYMVPTRIEVMPRLPRMPNGKLDRGRLLDSLMWSRDTPCYTLSDAQRRLAELVAPLIGCDATSLDPRRGLYEMGLNSLSLASLHARLQAAYPSACGLTLTELFQYSSLEQLARRLEGTAEDESVAASAATRSGRVERFKHRIRDDGAKEDRS